MSYSQNDEERYILEACKRLEGDARRFLDIGAYGPELSNTRALYEAGWSGLLVEPNPYAMGKLLDFYGDEPRLTYIQAAVGAEAGLKLMYMSHGPTSTTNEATYQQWRIGGEYAGSVWVPFITLEQLCTQFGAGFGFVSIDTEGTSQELALRFLSITNEVHCYCVEWDGKNTGLLNAMTTAGYHLIYASEENGVFSR